VPLIIRYPKGVSAPGRVSYQVQTLDLLPTILSLLGDTTSQAYRSLQGYDLLSSARHEFTIAEQSHPDLSTFYKRFPEADISRFNEALKMIRTEQNKYIWHSSGNHELYNLQEDPNEHHNIIETYPDIAASLDNKLTDWTQSFEPAQVSDDDIPEFDEKVKDRLRALGYLE
jgi:arylsulfatase A-like enzyme